MAYTFGRCTNVDYCTLASTKKDIQVPIGEEFVCPECARPLRTPPARESSGNLNLAIAGGVGALLLICGGVYAGYRMKVNQAVTARVAAPAVVAAAPPAAPAAEPTPAAALPATAPKVDTAVLLRLSGSATLGLQAAPKLAAAYLATLGNTDITERRGATESETLVSGERLGRREAISVVSAPGAAGDADGLAALGSATADVALATRRASRAELDRLRAAGDLASPSSEHVIGLEGEAVIVNPRNLVTQITVTQLRGVLSGATTNWSALGGSGPIHLVAEEGYTVLPGLSDGAAAPATQRRVLNAGPAVMDDPLAVAVVPLSRVGHARALAVAAVGAAPVPPSPADVANDSYPLSRKLYLYAPAGGSNPFAARFIAFALSAEGQTTLAQAGLVPLNAAPAALAAAPATLTPKERYRKLVSGATRLAADLHFEPNSNKLDLHSTREVDRVWNFMMSDHTPPDHLILIGFADNQGTPERNMALAEQRAKVVAAVFAKRGLPPGQVVAFGSDLSIADNAAEEGRQKNRRVEVFLRP